MTFTKLLTYLPLAFLPATSSLAIPTTLSERQAPCDSVHLFLARGNGEGYPGRVGDIATATCPLYDSCGSEDIQFDSTLSYCDAVGTGATNGLAQINAYAARCPSSKLVLAGYSEGANIVGDILGGNTAQGFYNCQEGAHDPLSPTSSPGTNVAAAVVFGDTRHVMGQSYNVGDGSGLNGEYPRSSDELANLQPWAGKLQNYCFAADPICALGTDGQIHETYMTAYAGTAANWIKGVVVV